MPPVLSSLSDPSILWPSLIVAAALAGIVVRPFRWPEAVWAVLGAVGVLACGTLTLPAALQAVGEGGDVYAFLLGMMLLSELAREQGLFDWIAAQAHRQAGGRALGLFNFVFLLGVGVTAVLSNDATAVVLTPAVLAIARRAKCDPMPPLFACATVANAASFVLPISNPANLVVFGNHMPGFVDWSMRFLLPSLVSIASTYAALRIVFRKPLAVTLDDGTADGAADGAAGCAHAAPALSGMQRMLLAAFVAIAALLMVVVSFGGPLGVATLGLTLLLVAGASLRARAWPRALVAHMSWQIFPLVGGLFVLVAAVRTLGGIGIAARWLGGIGDGPAQAAVAWLVGLVSNLANNLPVGLAVGMVNGSGKVPDRFGDLLLLAVDLGPNLAITGSLATLLWLAALRRGQVEVGFFSFLKVGLVVMPVPLCLTLMSRLALG